MWCRLTINPDLTCNTTKCKEKKQQQRRWILSDSTAQIYKAVVIGCNCKNVHFHSDCLLNYRPLGCRVDSAVLLLFLPIRWDLAGLNHGRSCSLSTQWAVMILLTSAWRVCLTYGQTIINPVTSCPPLGSSSLTWQACRRLGFAARCVRNMTWLANLRCELCSDGKTILIYIIYILYPFLHFL